MLRWRLGADQQGPGSNNGSLSMGNIVGYATSQSSMR